jgi:hypothetical protein
VRAALDRAHKQNLRCPTLILVMIQVMENSISTRMIPRSMRGMPII